VVRGQLTFISGGVRSGKSAYAEKMLIQESHQYRGRLVYIASGTKTDIEMKKRIEKHQLDRAEMNWLTIEQPVKLEEVLPLIKPGDLVLWDCVTTWLANELYDGFDSGEPCIEQPSCMTQKEKKLYETIDNILAKAQRFIIVSNEVFDELPSPYEEVEIYSKLLGNIHQNIVSKADKAIEMESGYARVWKGEDVN